MRPALGRRAAARHAGASACPGGAGAVARRADLGGGRGCQACDRGGAARAARAGGGVIAAVHIGLGQVAVTLALVAVAVAVSVWERTGLEADIAVAAARAFVQLSAIGYV